MFHVALSMVNTSFELFAQSTKRCKFNRISSDFSSSPFFCYDTKVYCKESYLIDLLVKRSITTRASVGKTLFPAVEVAALILTTKGSGSVKG